MRVNQLFKSGKNLNVYNMSLSWQIVLVVINKKILLTEYSSLGVIYFKP